MALIKPFECVRPNEKDAARVAALPYDVYNRQEAVVRLKESRCLSLKSTEQRHSSMILQIHMLLKFMQKQKNYLKKLWLIKHL